MTTVNLEKAKVIPLRIPSVYLFSFFFGKCVDKLSTYTQFGLM